MTAPYLFVRLQKHVSPVQANACGGVIVAVESHRGTFNRGREWWDALTCDRMGFIWLPLPGQWNPAETRETIRFLGSVKASAVMINAEPRSPTHKPHRWEDGHADEARRYMACVNEAAEKHGLAVGFTSWARTGARRRFPWAQFFGASTFSVTQPYEVHGRTGRAYVDACLADYRDHGHTDVWCGRGAHELDRSDDDGWRTAAEIAEHRESTPPGAKEAWWLPAGRLPESVLDAILANRGAAHASTEPPPAPFDRDEIEALAMRAAASDDKPAALALIEALDGLAKSPPL